MSLAAQHHHHLTQAGTEPSPAQDVHGSQSVLDSPGIKSALFRAEPAGITAEAAAEGRRAGLAGPEHSVLTASPGCGAATQAGDGNSPWASASHRTTFLFVHKKKGLTRKPWK